jgi:hypothetical protein
LRLFRKNHDTALTVIGLLLIGAQYGIEFGHKAWIDHKNYQVFSTNVTTLQEALDRRLRENSFTQQESEPWQAGLERLQVDSAIRVFDKETGLAVGKPECILVKYDLNTMKGQVCNDETARSIAIYNVDRIAQRLKSDEGWKQYKKDAELDKPNKDEEELLYLKMGIRADSGDVQSLSPFFP